jgi:hypothetical protein
LEIIFYFSDTLEVSGGRINPNAIILKLHCTIKRKTFLFYEKCPFCLKKSIFVRPKQKTKRRFFPQKPSKF